MEVTVSMKVPEVLHPFAYPAKEADGFLEIARGEGCRVWDGDGREYLDATASLWYCAVGHGRREIAAAAAAQMSQIEAYHTFGRFTNRPSHRLAERIVELQPIPEARVLFTVSGSEAIDSAMKLVRATHGTAGEGGRTIFLSRHNAYHGVMMGGTSMFGLPANRQPYGPLLPETFQVARDSLEAMRAAVAYHGAERVAAIFAEPVIGAGGVYPPPPGYLKGLRELCDECGALLVFDEVITGFGRLGSWFASHHYGITPDLMTFAKAVTSGYLPLGGVVVGPRVRATLEADGALLSHGGTYAGHPTCCAAALANLDLIEAEGLPDRARRGGARLRAGLEGLADHPGVVEVRGEGLMQAIQLEPPLTPADFTEALLGQGVIGRGLPYANSVAFSPPLIVSDEEVDQIVEAVQTVLEQVTAAA